VSQELRERMMAKSREVDGEKLARDTRNLRANSLFVVKIG
jgi:hypothetical protein